jgi:hypothetical protein
MNFTHAINNQSFTFFHLYDQYVNENNAEEKRNIRGYRDNATKAYVNHFLGDNQIFTDFLNYTFHSLNGSLLSEINKELIVNNHKPLYDAENVDFLFKGGNIMNKYFSIYEAAVRRHIVIDNEFTDIKKNFAISDIDYGVHIENVRYDRYVIICNYAIRILARTLDEITNLYDLLYLNRNDDAAKQRLITSIPREFHIVDNDQIYNYYLYENSKILLNGLKGFILDIEIKNYQHRERNIFDAIINEININLANLSVYEIILYINIFQCFGYIQYIKGINIIVNIDNILHTLKDMLTIKINIKRNKVIMRNQYNDVNILNYIQNICDLLNEKNADGSYKEIDFFRYEKKNDDLFGVKILSPLVPGDIEINNRKNIIISSQNSIIDMIGLQNLNPNKYHYVSLNNTIHVKKNNNNDIEFYLLRSKFNTIIKKDKILKRKINKDGTYANSNVNLNIPSEFIDISIAGYNDTTDKMMKTVHLIGNNYLNFNNNIIKVYNLEEIIYDLEIVLFSQNYFVPWINQKYDKRIIRMIFFIILNSLVKDAGRMADEFQRIDKIISLINQIKINIETGNIAYIDVIDNFINIQNSPRPYLNYLKYLIDNNSYELYIRKEYDKYSYLLKSIIINYILLTQYNNNRIFEFISKMRKYYSYTNLDMTQHGHGRGHYINNFSQNYLNMIRTLNKEFIRFRGLDITGISRLISGGKKRDIDTYPIQKINSPLLEIPLYKGKTEKYEKKINSPLLEIPFYKGKTEKYEQKIKEEKKQQFLNNIIRITDITENTREIFFNTESPFILIQSKKIYTEPSQNYNNNFINIDKIDTDMKNDKEEYDNNYNDYDDVEEIFD